MHPTAMPRSLLAPLALVGLLVTGCASAPRPPLEPPPSGFGPAEGAESSFSVGADLRAAPGRFWDDTKLGFGEPRTYLFLGLAGLYAIAQERGWEDQERAFFEHHTLFSSGTQDGLGALGNGATLYAGALAWYFTAMIQEDAASYEASKTVLSALTVTSAATLLLKGTLHDGRPNGGSHDFPSGHASLSMAAASSLGELYGPAVGVPAYTLAGLVGLQRLDTEKHDTGAVVFGWTLGFLVGYTLGAHEAPRILGLQVGLYQDPDSGDLGLTLYGGL